MADIQYTWTDYKNWVTTIVTNNYSFLCRGHADSNWKLQTTFHRTVKYNNYTLDYYNQSIIPVIHSEICAMRD
ncbi:MAG: hypothetical protein HQK92_13020 [Nitrospirae bacterium]|nr:hypothetical protein [Nitrospirota bacterium]